jgi:adenylate kinase family enzyme
VSEEVLLERCLVRAAGSEVKREDDNEETLKKRLRAFKELSRPVVDLYQKFGKVRYIDAGFPIETVYQMTRKAMLPEIFYIIGPKCSGKTALGSALADRTNMNTLNFSKFVKDHGLKDEDCETKTQALIKHLVNETAPRILLEDFPQTLTQAKYFQKNCVTPSHAFYTKSSKDTCQERMLNRGNKHPEYLPSAILSKKIKKFHD